MRVLGIDPGSAHVGVAVLEFDDRGAPTWVDAEEVKPDVATMPWVGEQVIVYQADLVAVETPVPRAAFALRQLIETARVAERMLCGADNAGVERMEFTSYEWRKRLTGASNAKDAVIKFALEAHMAVPRSNSHKRDAAGVAVIAGWERFFGRMAA